MLNQIHDFAAFTDNINDGNYMPHCKGVWLSILGLGATRIFGTHYGN